MIYVLVFTMQMLTVCLLYEIGKGKGSWWYPYLVHLPQSYDILATFGEFQRQALQVRCLIIKFLSAFFLG